MSDETRYLTDDEICLLDTALRKSARWKGDKNLEIIRLRAENVTVYNGPNGEYLGSRIDGGSDE